MKIALCAAIIIYLIMMLSIGISQSRKNKTTDDFYLGGRKLGPFVTAMSSEASDMSSWLLMGLPGVALITGLAEASWTAIGLAIGTYINWLIVAKRLRLYSEKIGAVTIPEFFSKRFGDDKNVLSLIAAVIIIIFFVPYTASGFSACGKLFSTIFPNLGYIPAMIISAAVIVIYCTTGGFLAASTTDFVQSIVMTISLFVVLGIGEAFAGGFGSVFNNVAQMDGFLNLFKGFDVTSMTTGSYGALPVASTLAWGLGYFGMPHILLRFMAIENPSKLKTSRRVASVWVVFSMAIAILIGVVGYCLMQKGIVGPYDSSSAAETVIIDISRFISSKGFIAAFAAGIFLSGILASTMSTADSQLIAASSSVTKDIVKNFFKSNISEKKLMIVARLSVIVIAVIAVFLARNPNSSVFRIVSFAWAGFGAAFGPAMLAGLFWKRTNKYGVLAGMISGAVMIFFWKFGIRNWFADTALNIYELLPAFIVSLIFIIVVSLITSKPEKNITAVFDEVKKEIK